MSERIHHRQPNQVYGQGMLKDGAGQFGCPSPSNNDQIFPKKRIISGRMGSLEVR